ncbi:hypothetical protein [Mesorhizobium delmotii]
MSGQAFLDHSDCFKPGRLFHEWPWLLKRHLGVGYRSDHHRLVIQVDCNRNKRRHFYRSPGLRRLNAKAMAVVASSRTNAADRIADMSRADLQIILRRAVLMLRNVSGVPLEPSTEDALNSIAAEMKIGRSDLIQIVLREWLKTNAYLPVRTIDEESETDGNV